MGGGLRTEGWEEGRRPCGGEKFLMLHDRCVGVVEDYGPTEGGEAVCRREVEEGRW